MSDRYTHGHHESVLRSHTWRTAENSAAYLLPHLEPGIVRARRGLRPGHDHEGPRRPRRSRPRARHRRLGRGDRAGAPSGGAGRVRRRRRVRASSSTTARSTSSTPTRCCSTSPIPSPHWASCDGCCARAGCWPSATAITPRFFWAPTAPCLDRWLELYHLVTARNGAEADAGRQLPSWVRRAGFDEVTTSSSTWTFADPESRAWWGGLWADRIRYSAFATQAVEYGLSDADRAGATGRGWRTWAAAPDGLFVVAHVEVLARR